MQKGSFNHSEYEELLRLKNEINEKIRDYNQNASEEELFSDPRTTGILLLATLILLYF